MLIWLAAAVLVIVVVSAVSVRLLPRRRAPDPGWFIDSTRAAGALTVIGTMFSTLPGLHDLLRAAELSARP